MIPVKLLGCGCCLLSIEKHNNLLTSSGQKGGRGRQPGHVDPSSQGGPGAPLAAALVHSTRLFTCEGSCLHAGACRMAGEGAPCIYFHSSPSGLCETAWMVSSERVQISLCTSSMLLEASTTCPHGVAEEGSVLVTAQHEQEFQMGMGSGGHSTGTSGSFTPPFSDPWP